eukprot:m.141141 g.141141  ORF g.141141 m.141141 type:complete len:157 (-) comp24137_c0_seq1:2892-3362(-)
MRQEELYLPSWQSSQLLLRLLLPSPFAIWPCVPSFHEFLLFSQPLAGVGAPPPAVYVLPFLLVFAFLAVSSSERQSSSVDLALLVVLQVELERHSTITQPPVFVALSFPPVRSDMPSSCLTLTETSFTTSLFKSGAGTQTRQEITSENFSGSCRTD